MEGLKRFIATLSDEEIALLLAFLESVRGGVKDGK